MYADSSSVYFFCFHASGFAWVFGWLCAGSKHVHYGLNVHIIHHVRVPFTIIFGFSNLMQNMQIMYRLNHNCSISFGYRPCSVFTVRCVILPQRNNISLGIWVDNFNRLNVRLTGGVTRRYIAHLVLEHWVSKNLWNPRKGRNTLYVHQRFTIPGCCAKWGSH